jgi:hypothetical protein
VAVCSFCNQEMTVAEGCVTTPITIKGRAYANVRFGTEPGYRKRRGRPVARCGDCNVVMGAVHHHGCDMEVCPRCRGQAILCGCVWDDEVHLTDAWLEELEDRFCNS